MRSPVGGFCVVAFMMCATPVQVVDDASYIATPVPANVRVTPEYYISVELRRID